MNKGAFAPWTSSLLHDSGGEISHDGAPVDLSQLGQIAILGQFDALTPVLAERQQNSYMPASFSIVEIDTIQPPSPNSNNGSSTIAHIDPFSTYDSSSETLPPMTVPILLASFSMGNLTDQEKAEWGIKATCTLSQAPHQIYVAGHFSEFPSNPPRNKGNESGSGNMPFFPSAASPHTREFDHTNFVENHGLNNIGVYDTRLKRFFSLDQGLDGPVYDLYCDSDANAVYAVGGFFAPLGLRGSQQQPGSASTYSTPAGAPGSTNGDFMMSTAPPHYGQLGAFGGGVAVWKNGSPSNQQSHSRYPNSIPGMWVALPFKGVNGVLRAIARDSQGYFYFGGLFDTTTDGEQTSAPDAQPVNLNGAMITSGNGAPGDQESNIVCQHTKQQRTNWLMQDNTPGYWRIEFPFHITPTLLRLWNVKPGPGATVPSKGTQIFRVLDMPSNQPINLSFVDPITMMTQYCVECTLLPDWEASQDFVIVRPELVQGLQIDVLSWYGSGGGLGGFEVYQSEIFARGADNFNFPDDVCLTPSMLTKNSTKASSTVVASSAVPNNGDSQMSNQEEMKAYATHSGADWRTVMAPHGWQHVIAASVSAHDESERNQAKVDMVPYLQEAGLYDVYLYTPRCTPTSPVLEGNVSFACDMRGSIDVKMYFHSDQEAISITLSQTSSKDTAEKIYSGMVAASSSTFQPHIVIGPSLSKSGVGAGTDRQTVIVDSIQFVKQATLDDANSLVLYRPPTQTASHSELKQNASTVFHGIDGSSWRTLPKQLPFGSLIQSMVTVENQVFIAGSFDHSSYSNIVVWDTDKDDFVPLGRAPIKDNSSGLNANVSSMALWNDELYIAGSFNQAIDGVLYIPLRGGLARYSITTRQWTEFGNVTGTFQAGARFEALELSADDQLIVRGNMRFLNETTTRLFAVWDLQQQQWLREDQFVDADGQTRTKHPLGQVSGTVSYMHRFGLKNSAQQPRTLLIAGPLNSIDTFLVDKPNHIGWLNVQGALGATNLISDDLTDRHAISDPSPISVYPPPAPATNISLGPDAMAFEQINAGIVYFNRVKRTWHTVVGGRRQGNWANAGIFSSAEKETTTQVKSFKGLNGIQELRLQGEILALGLLKNSEDGSNDRASNDDRGDGADLLLLGGAFQSLAAAGGMSGLAIYDLKNDRFVHDNVPSARGFDGNPGTVRVIKSHPRSKSLVIAGSFEGIGKDIDCPLVCLWDPSVARTAIDRHRDIKSSFKAFSRGGSKQSVRGVVNDFAFEDDKNMLVVGDLVIDGVACGAASFNTDSLTWTTFGSLVKADPKSPSASASGSSHTNGTKPTLPVGDDVLFGPPTAVAHDSTFHRFFVAGKDSFTGAAYFKKWTGKRFIRISAEFLPTSEVYQLELMTASSNAPIRGPLGTDGTKDYADLSHIDAANDNSPPFALAHGSGAGDRIALANSNKKALDPSDTTQILEQGYILLVSGSIALSRGIGRQNGGQSSSWYQEVSVAFFDGQSWFPFLQSSRPASFSTKEAAEPLATERDGLNPSTSGFKRAAGTTSKPWGSRSLTSHYRQPVNAGLLPQPAQALAKFVGSTQGSSVNHGARRQGVFRTLAFQHLPRIIAREYLALPYVILISIAISLALVLLIVLFGFFYAWLKRRLSKDPENVTSFTFTRPRSRPDSSFIEEEAAAAMFANGGYGGPPNYMRNSHYSGSNVGAWSNATGAFLAGAAGPAALRRTSSASKEEKTANLQSGGFFSRFGPGNGSGDAKGKKPHGSMASLVASLNLADVLDRKLNASTSTHHSGLAGSTGAGTGAGGPAAPWAERPYRTAGGSPPSKGRASPPATANVSGGLADAAFEKIGRSGAVESHRSPGGSSHRRRRSALHGPGGNNGAQYYVEELQRIRRQEEDLARSLANSNSRSDTPTSIRSKFIGSGANNTCVSLDRMAATTPAGGGGSTTSLQDLPQSASNTPPLQPQGAAAAGRPPIIYRSNSTLAEATGALVSEFVRSHQRQLGRASTMPLTDSAGETKAGSRTPSPKKKQMQASTPPQYEQQQQQPQQLSPTKTGDALDTVTEATAAAVAAQQEQVEPKQVQVHQTTSTPPAMRDRFQRGENVASTPETTSKDSKHRHMPPDRDSSNSDLLNPIASGGFSVVGGPTDFATSNGSPHSVRQPDVLGVSRTTGSSEPHGGSGGGQRAEERNDNGSETEGAAAPAPAAAATDGEAGGRGSLASNSTIGGVVYYAKYPFRAREIGELGFNAGDKILVVDNSDDIWWMGVLQLENGQQVHGVFPSNYVGPSP
ncbi:hypothetical protein BGW42_000489 [Actinomortierella wolfii]|nr:hypothetical protein BGW42_000489 [Actinomortierella wolfii]